MITTDGFRRVALVFSRQTPTVAFISDGTGQNIYRFDVSSPGGSWYLISDQYNRVHSDMRFLAIDASNQLCVASDGGVARLNSPTPETVSVHNLNWVSLVGDMSVSELHAVSYNANGNTLLVGTQDNSCGQLNSNGSWSGIGQGDGGQVAVWSTATESTSYYSAQIFLAPQRVDCPAGGGGCTTTAISADGANRCRPMSYWPIRVVFVLDCARDCCSRDTPRRMPPTPAESRSFPQARRTPLMEFCMSPRTRA